MTQKYLTIQEINLSSFDEEAESKKLNYNFTLINDYSGLGLKKSVDVTLPTHKWTNYGNKIPDVNNKGKEIDNPTPQTIKYRQYIVIDVTTFAFSAINYSDVILLPETAETDKNVNMHREIARCGIELAAHTDFGKLFDDDNKKFMALMFRALNDKPTMDIKYKLILI